MAKLKARGRQELARVTREREICHAQYTERVYDWGTAPIYCALTKGHAGPHSGEALTLWERRTRTLMSDGKILEKLDVRFPNKYRGDYLHSYGWKVRAKVTDGVTREAFVAAYTNPTRADGSWTLA